MQVELKQVPWSEQSLGHSKSSTSVSSFSFPSVLFLKNDTFLYMFFLQLPSMTPKFSKAQATLSVAYKISANILDHRKEDNM